ncbi:cysteine proteinase [Anaeramoeba flamelloides]|uniref:Cysteine proteinase n=1 Tax=Anaeramoeba flamelloides TaxID=1746091 RepID=A0ABQ8XPD5_9EUKA|nr:cysteine proteinase [Anaeramoeba flamelloides]
MNNLNFTENNQTFTFKIDLYLGILFSSKLDVALRIDTEELETKKKKKKEKTKEREINNLKQKLKQSEIRYQLLLSQHSVSINNYDQEIEKLKNIVKQLNTSSSTSLSSSQSSLRLNNDFDSFTDLKTTDKDSSNRSITETETESESATNSQQMFVNSDYIKLFRENLKLRNQLFEMEKQKNELNKKNQIQAKSINHYEKELEQSMEFSKKSTVLQGKLVKHFLLVKQENNELKMKFEDSINQLNNLKKSIHKCDKIEKNVTISTKKPSFEIKFAKSKLKPMYSIEKNSIYLDNFPTNINTFDNTNNNNNNTNTNTTTNTHTNTNNNTNTTITHNNNNHTNTNTTTNTNKETQNNQKIQKIKVENNHNSMNKPNNQVYFFENQLFQNLINDIENFQSTILKNNSKNFNYIKQITSDYQKLSSKYVRLKFQYNSIEEELYSKNGIVKRLTNSLLLQKGNSNYQFRDKLINSIQILEDQNDQLKNRELKSQEKIQFLQSQNIRFQKSLNLLQNKSVL